jgi:hypothetical protein
VTPSASLSSGGNSTIRGFGRFRGGFRFGRRFRRFVNLTVSGTDTCGARNVVGVSAGGTVTESGFVVVDGSPTPTTQSVSPVSPSATGVIQNLQATATPILSADSTHVTLSSDGTHYIGTNVALGRQSGGGNPALPVIVYSDKPLTLSGSTAGGAGILLVKGDLSITGGLNYAGLIVVEGNVTLANNSGGSIVIRGAVISSGDLSADSNASRYTSLTIDYDSCAVSQAFQATTPQNVTVLGSREISY